MTRRNRLPELLGKGLYTPPQVARFVELSPSTVRRWLQGYQFRYATRGGRRRGASGPVIRGGVPVLRNRRAVTFVELVEVLVVAAFLKEGLRLGTLRRVARRAAEKLGSAHPFAYERFKTDGKDVYLEVLEEASPDVSLLGLAGGQYAFHPILDPYLRQLDFDTETLMAIRWWPLGKRKPVVLDPEIAFGSPVIAGTRLPVRVVLDALHAGETKRSVCEWHGIRPRELDAAVELGEQNRAA